LEAEGTYEQMQGQILIMDTYFYQKLENNETHEIHLPLANYNSIKRVRIFFHD
jgi:hypothetical protein